MPVEELPEYVLLEFSFREARLSETGLPLTSLVLSVMFKIVQARGARASNLQRL
jgi:hypothetical protein